VALNQPITRDFIFRALSPKELPLALQVRKAVYVDELAYDAAGVLRDPLDDRAQHFLGTTRDGSPVAAMRIIRWDARPFEVESFLDMTALLTSESRAGEISRLCILEKYRNLTRTQFVHAGMWKLAYDYALRSDLEEFLIWAPPPLARVYEYLGFSRVPSMVFQHPLFANRPYQVLSVDLLGLEEDYRKRRHPLSNLLFGTPHAASSEMGSDGPATTRHG
jgi:predicted GNAT family N-acyltransferase